jgi:predicted transposase YbfD/YdcC
MVVNKTSEITTVPEILDALDLAGALISCDASNTQKTTVEKLLRPRQTTLLL